jgi:SNF2 family DNA or RNA helicase
VVTEEDLRISTFPVSKAGGAGDQKTLALVDDHLALIFPYDRDQVAEIKRISGAKWDKIARAWRVPMTSLDQAREFAQRHGFWVDPDVMTFDLPEPDNHITGVSKDGPWIFLSFRFDPVKVRAVKSIPGVTWHAKTKAWRVPETSIAEAIVWADRFGEEVPLELRQEADDIRSRHQELIEASRSTDAELEIPGLEAKLMPYQRAGVKYASNARRCFIADDMGLGKTLQAIAALELNQAYPAVVVCPPTLVLNWKKEYAKWLPTRTVECVTNRKDFPTGEYDVLVIGWSNIHHWVRQVSGFRSYVFDESHYAKSPTAQRTKAAVKMARSGKKDGMVLCLTGTPITNRPAEYAPQLDIIGRLDKFGGLWGFYRRYCGAFRDRFGQWHIDGNSNLDELNDRLRGECYIRRTKDQVLTELPPVIHSRVYVEGTDSGMKEYRKAEADIVQYLVERAKEIALELGQSPKSAAVRAKMAAEASQHLVRISILRKLAAQAKMPAIKEWVQSHIDAGQKVVIAAHHREVVDELASQFGGLKIQGGMTVEAVEEHKAIFQSKSCEEAPVIVLSIQAAKTGHTLTAAQNVLFVELPWTPADVDQTYSRCHRIGQEGSVTATYMLAGGTIDEEIYGLIDEKRAVVNAAIDGIEVEAGESNASRIISLFTEKGDL